MFSFSRFIEINLTVHKNIPFSMYHMVFDDTMENKTVKALFLPKSLHSNEERPTASKLINNVASGLDKRPTG